jgi:hypothetical protein
MRLLTVLTSVAIVGICDLLLAVWARKIEESLFWINISYCAIDFVELRFLWSWMTVESSKWLSIIILLNCSLDFANQSKVICSFSLRIKLSSKRITHWVNVRRISWFVPLLQLSSSFMIDIDEDLWVFMTCIQRLSTIVRHTSSLNSQDVTFFKFKGTSIFSP